MKSDLNSIVFLVLSFNLLLGCSKIDAEEVNDPNYRDDTYSLLFSVSTDMGSGRESILASHGYILNGSA